MPKIFTIALLGLVVPLAGCSAINADNCAYARQAAATATLILEASCRIAGASCDNAGYALKVANDLVEVACAAANKP